MINVMSMSMSIALLLALLPKMESNIRPRFPRVAAPQPPLCVSQFALANYACGRLPFTHVPPPSPPSPPYPPDDDNDHGHRRGHGHGHGHRHHHHGSPQENDCCRWVKEVDSQCVCELLLHLPPFLIKPRHEYTLVIQDSCNVTYSCGGPIWFSHIFPFSFAPHNCDTQPLCKSIYSCVSLLLYY